MCPPTLPLDQGAAQTGPYRAPPETPAVRSADGTFGRGDAIDVGCFTMRSKGFWLAALFAAEEACYLAPDAAAFAAFEAVEEAVP